MEALTDAELDALPVEILRILLWVGLEKQEVMTNANDVRALHIP